jgi:hypothetical protein
MTGGGAVALVALLVLAAFTLFNGGSPATSSRTPSPSPSPALDAEEIARSSFPELQDLPSGFRSQGSQVDKVSSAGQQAIGSISFSRSLTTSQALLGLAVTVGGAVVVYDDEATAAEQSGAETLKAVTTLTFTAQYYIAQPDSAIISFPSLGDATAAVELSGNGIVGGQSGNIGVRAVQIRQGRVVVTIVTTSLGLGPISELEEIARSLSGRLSTISQ